MQEWFGNEDECVIGPYIPSVPRNRFERFQDVKVIPGDKTFWTNEKEFF
jgi:hypothetical protein